jgi:hypothetical protein
MVRTRPSKPMTAGSTPVTRSLAPWVGRRDTRLTCGKYRDRYPEGALWGCMSKAGGRALQAPRDAFDSRHLHPLHLRSRLVRRQCHILVAVGSIPTSGTLNAAKCKAVAHQAFQPWTSRFESGWQLSVHHRRRSGTAPRLLPVAMRVRLLPVVLPVFPCSERRNGPGTALLSRFFVGSNPTRSTSRPPFPAPTENPGHIFRRAPTGGEEGR